MSDPRIHSQQVIEAIYAEANARRIIWSPCTTLAVMGIERYPRRSNQNRRAMKQVLEELHAAGHLIRRPQLHAHYTFKEVAYERHPDGIWEG